MICQAYRSESERVDFYTKSSHVLLLELSSQVTLEKWGDQYAILWRRGGETTNLDESRLASSTVTDFVASRIHREMQEDGATRERKRREEGKQKGRTSIKGGGASQSGGKKDVERIAHRERA